MNAKIEALYKELDELEKSVLTSGFPLTALKIAGSRIDMAFSSQNGANIVRAQRDLDDAIEFYRFYEEGQSTETLGIINDMRDRLSLDHPNHYLLNQY